MRRLSIASALLAVAALASCEPGASSSQQDTQAAGARAADTLPPGVKTEAQIRAEGPNVPPPPGPDSVRKLSGLPVAGGGIPAQIAARLARDTLPAKRALGGITPAYQIIDFRGGFTRQRSGNLQWYRMNEGDSAQVFARAYAATSGTARPTQNTTARIRYYRVSGPYAIDSVKGIITRATGGWGEVESRWYRSDGIARDTGVFEIKAKAPPPPPANAFNDLCTVNPCTDPIAGADTMIVIVASKVKGDSVLLVKAGSLCFPTPDAPCPEASPTTVQLSGIAVSRKRPRRWIDWLTPEGQAIIAEWAQKDASLRRALRDPKRSA